MKSKTVAYISHNALAADKLPDALTLLKWGANETDRGSLSVTATTQAAIAAQRKGGVYDRVLIDFEHSSCAGHPNYVPPPRKHAGAGFVFCDPERGLGVERIAWTPSGVEFAREYPDLSPAVSVDSEGAVTGLVSLALVPNGGVVGLSFFNAEEPTMSNEELAKLTERLAALQTALEALAEQARTLKTENVWLRQQRDELAKELESRAPLAGFQALESKVENVSNAWKTELEAIRSQYAADLECRDKAAILHLAAAAGKIVALPDAAIAKLSAKDLAEHVAALAPGAAPLTRVTPLDAEPPAPDAAAASAEAAPRIRALAARLQREKGLSYQRAWVEAEKAVSGIAAKIAV